jgi:hypothetical protein
MNKSSVVILVIGLVAISVAYVLLYTPVYDMIWGIKVPKVYSLPSAPAVSTPAVPPPVKVVATIEAAKATAEARPKPAVTAKKTATAEVVPKFVTLRDPFEVDFAYIKVEAPPEAGKPAAPEAPKAVLVLQGIFMSGTQTVAIIDDKVVSEGSRVAEGWKVSEIRSDMVILSKGGRIKTLRMKVGG